MSVRNITNETFKYGQIDSIEKEAIPRGAVSDGLNWLTKGTHIELRRGQRFLGTDSVVTGVGKMSAVKKTTRADGVEQLFGARGKELIYYDRATEEVVEIGSDLLGNDIVDANGLPIEPVSMEEYVGLAGNQLFVNSPHAGGYYKIMVANPGSSADQFTDGTNYKGHIKIDTNRTLLFGRPKDQTGLYGSYIDEQAYTTVTNENLGASGSTVYSGTLAFKGGGSKRTCFALEITGTTGAGVETFVDDYCGVLTGSLGGTGTINYMTGAYSLTFNGAVTSGNVEADYQWEDSTANGICDFGFTSPTRLAGEGFVFRQDEGGGALKSIAQYNQIYYCMHVKKTWVLNITSTDTAATNLPYREKVGTPNMRARVETGEGIYYIDDADKNDVKARLLSYDINGSDQVVPIPVSQNLDLSKYRFDQAAAFEFGDFILFACATTDSVQTIDGESVSLNNRTLVFNKVWKSWDILDYSATCFDVYDGALVAGDSYSGNFLELFSGRDDFNTDPPFPNYAIFDSDDLDAEGLKKVKKLRLKGLIERDQRIKVSISYGNGAFSEIGHTDVDDVHTYAIEGQGEYVDAGAPTLIGASVLGKNVIGGSLSNVIRAYPYERLFSIRTAKFDRIRLKVEAMGIGYVSVSMYSFWDVRFKEVDVSTQYKG